MPAIFERRQKRLRAKLLKYLIGHAEIAERASGGRHRKKAIQLWRLKERLADIANMNSGW